MTDPAMLEDHARRIADLAATTAMQYFRGALGVEFKSDESPVTQADKAVEEEVRAYLRDAFPGHGIFGEEHGIEGQGAAEMWVIDPIDGTRSFLSGHPLFGFLLAHLKGGKLDLGVIGMPALGEVFIGQPGRGAFAGDAPIHASNQTRLDQCILYINEGDRIYHDAPALFDRLMRTGQTRRLSYDCYPYALLASGHVDAIVDYWLQPYDYLAVSAVVRAAGGCMTDWQGAELHLGSDGKVAASATPELHAALLDVLNA